MEARIGAAALARLVGEPASDRTTYLWFAERIERLVADGRLTHGTRLPGERDVAAAMGLSRTPITQAYARLRERGFAAARHGSGTRIVVPGGRVHGDGEPLAGVLGLVDGSADAVINMTNAAPRAIPGLTDRFMEATSQLGAYTRSGGYFRNGIPELRTRIAQRYTAAGAPTEPEQIIVTTGALSGLATVATAFITAGTRVAVESCGYPNALAALRTRGARFAGIPQAADGGPWDMAGIVDLIAQRRPAAMMITPDFHNPTGRLMPEDQRAELAALWKRHEVIGLVDETSTDLWWDEPPAVRPMVAHAPGCVSFGSASKTYWGGLRLGWVRAPRELVGAVTAARVLLDLGAPVLDQIVLAALLRDQPGLDEERRRELAAQRVSLRDEITARCPGWTCELPPGGLSLWWKLPGPHSSEIVRRAALRGLALTPGGAFSFDGRGLEGRLRTPFTLPGEQLSQAVDLLAEVAATM